MPEPLQDELEVRGLDPAGRRFVRAQPAARGAEVDLARGSLVEHFLDERRLDLDRLAGELVEALHGSHDRFSGGVAIEVVEPQVVREEVRNPALEAVELGECVVPQRDEDTDAKTRCVTSSGSSTANPLSASW